MSSILFGKQTSPHVCFTQLRTQKVKLLPRIYACKQLFSPMRPVQGKKFVNSCSLLPRTYACKQLFSPMRPVQGKKFNVLSFKLS